MTPDENTDQNTGDLYEAGADVLDALDYPTERVDEVRNSVRLQEAFTDRRIRLIQAENPGIAEQIKAGIEAEKADEAAAVAAEEETARLAALDEQQHAEAMDALQDQATAEARQAEMDTFLADGGIDKARALADAVADKQTSPSEALARWDEADALTREIASTQFGVGVIDFDPNPEEIP
jgi:hypothetical protein